MLRPASIVTFERCYLGAWLIDFLNILLNWNATIAAIGASPSAAQLGPSFAVIIQVGWVAIETIVTFLLWYFVARRGSAAAKWIVIVLFVIGFILFVIGVVRGGVGIGIAAIAYIVQIVLQAIAIAMLFRPDTKAWFGEAVGDPVA